MNKLLIVDDQAVVRSGIIKMVKEMNIPISAVFEAADGLEAIEVINSSRPDIIMVDIMMARMDGMQLIEAIKKDNYKAHIIIVSAYNDFEYTKKAINFKVDDYLLKPVSQNELYQTLLSVIERIYDETETDKLAHKRETSYYNMLLYDYLSGRDVFVDVQSIYKHTGLQAMTKPYYSIAVINRHGPEDENAAACFSEVKNSIDRELKNRKVTFLSFEYGTRQVVYIFNLETNENGVYIDCIKRHQETSAIPMNCGISAAEEKRDSLAKLFNQAELALKESVFKGVAIYLFSEIKKFEGSILSMAQYRIILDYIKLGSREDLSNELDLLFIKISEADLSVEDTKNFLLGIVNFLYINLIDDYPAAQQLLNARDDLHRSGVSFKMKAIVKNQLLKLSDDLVEYGSVEVSNQVIRDVLNYINNNFNKDLSLAFITNKLDMNYSYVSGLFVKTVGISFSEYIMKLRLEKSRELLLNSALKIYEVAEKVGFKDSKYFCKVFKKYFNKTPAEFKAGQ